MEEKLLRENEEAFRQLLLNHRVQRFLYREADLLDSRKLDEWLDLLAEDIEYRMPRRITHEHETDAYLSDSFLFKDTYNSLKARIDRFESEYAWSERPPSRARRHVGSVWVRDERDREVDVSSTVLVYYSQGDTSDHTFFSAKRDDTLRRTDDGFEITKRVIYADHTVIGMNKLSIFL